VVVVVVVELLFASTQRLLYPAISHTQLGVLVQRHLLVLHQQL